MDSKTLELLWQDSCDNIRSAAASAAALSPTRAEAIHSTARDFCSLAVPKDQSELLLRESQANVLTNQWGRC